jgi:hypothetical protein
LNRVLTHNVNVSEKCQPYAQVIARGGGGGGVAAMVEESSEEEEAEEEEEDEEEKDKRRAAMRARLAARRREEAAAEEQAAGGGEMAFEDEDDDDARPGRGRGGGGGEGSDDDEGGSSSWETDTDASDSEDGPGGAVQAESSYYPSLESAWFQPLLAPSSENPVSKFDFSKATCTATPRRRPRAEDDQAGVRAQERAVRVGTFHHVISQLKHVKTHSVDDSQYVSV